MARFRNGFRDRYDVAFPWVEDKRSRKDVEKPWLDDAEFRELVKEKQDLYSRKIRGRLQEGEGLRLDQVTREVNKKRRAMRKAYFGRRFEEVSGDLRATWEALGEVLRGRRGRRTGLTCGYFRKEG